jgi:Ca2+-binding RTX toxin-like protein
LITANDEDQMIRVYDPARSGAPVAEIPLVPIAPAPGRAPRAFTDSSDGIARELDIEGVTVVGSRMWWIGSHANSASGADRPNRERLFATDVSGTGAGTTLTSAGYYRFLEDDLVAWDTGNTHGRGANFFGISASQANTVVPEATNGFNIEGLTTSPDNSALWVAFRAPIVPATGRTNALIVPVTNYTTIITATGGTTGSATFGAPIELNLGGRGIRSIERAADGTYLIVAGPAGSAGAAPNDFRLYTWNGQAATAPVLRPVDLSGVLNGGSIEGIASLPGSLGTDAVVQLVLDNGDSNFYGDGVLNKDRPEAEQRKSSLVTVRLDGSALVPPPEPTPQPTASFGSTGSVALPAGSFVNLAGTTGTQTAAATRTFLDAAATRLGADPAEVANLRSLVAGFTDAAGGAIDFVDLTPTSPNVAAGTTTITGGAGLDAVVFAADQLPIGSRVVLANVEFAMVSGRVTVVSDDRTMRIAGDEQAQRIETATGADSIAAGGGDDTVLAGAGDDVITPGTGRDIVDGGAGSDTVVVAAARSATTLRQFGLFTELSSADGVDRLVRVETVTFSSGERQSLNPVAPFASLDGAAAQATVARGGFDAAFYFARNPDVLAALPAGSTVEAAFQFARGHYGQFGWREGRDPNTLFVTNTYLATHTDVRAAAADPLLHFTNFGWREGRGSAGLDTAAYLTANPDVRLAGVDPMSHLFAFGFGEGRGF